MLSSDFVCRGNPALRKIGEIGLARSVGYYRQHGPLPSGMGSRSGPSSYFKEEDDLNSEDAEVLSGGTDVVRIPLPVGVRCLRCCRALPGPCQRSVDFQVYVFTPDPSGGRGELAMVISCCRPWHSAACATCGPENLSRQVASSVSSLSVVILVPASTR